VGVQGGHLFSKGIAMLKTWAEFLKKLPMNEKRDKAF